MNRTRKTLRKPLRRLTRTPHRIVFTASGDSLNVDQMPASFTTAVSATRLLLAYHARSSCRHDPLWTRWDGSAPLYSAPPAGAPVGRRSTTAGSYVTPPGAIPQIPRLRSPTDPPLPHPVDPTPLPRP